MKRLGPLHGTGVNIVDGAVDGDTVFQHRVGLKGADVLSEFGSNNSKLKRKQTLSQAFSFDENGAASAERSASTELNFAVKKVTVKVMSETCK